MGLLIIILAFILIEALVSLVVVRFGWGAYECLMIHAVLYGFALALGGLSVTPA